uniref:Uncharacterized protein n=1 Tax=Arundo donax TaxID=35708 RepID=A0A0A9AYA8_ARUDO
MITCIPESPPPCKPRPWVPHSEYLSPTTPRSIASVQRYTCRLI